MPHLPHISVIFQLKYGLFSPNWSYRGQNYQNVPQISSWETETILFVLFYQIFFI